MCEIGGGTGVFLLSLAQHYSSVHFSDVLRESPLFSTPGELTELTEITSSSIHYTVADATNLSYCSNLFDSVFVLDVLEHVPDERSAISEIARVTSNSGKAIISAPIEVGILVLAREGYRMVDADRRQTKNISELWSAFTGCPVLEQNKGHRSYDYRQTIRWLRQDFNQISVEYCRWP